MIQLATDKEKPLVRQMWQTVFGDDDKFVDIYFEQKYKNDNTLVYFVDGQVAASLQMWEYNFSYYDKVIPCYYLAGLATYEQHRRKGYMSELIGEAFRLMAERRIPLSVLVPAEDWLFTFYEQYGYIQAFDGGSDVIPLKKILNRHKTLEKAFEMFDRIYNKGSFKVLKNIDQFKTIIEEQELTDFAPKTNIDAVARVVDVFAMMKIYAKSNPSKRFTIKVVGDKQIRENNRYYTIEDGHVTVFPNAIADFEVSILDVCQLLLGYDNEEFEARLSHKFPKHRPTLNLMLE